MSAGDLIRADLICNAPCASHCSGTAQIWQIGRVRYKICQKCAGCYGVSDDELATVTAPRASLLANIATLAQDWERRKQRLYDDDPPEEFPDRIMLDIIAQLEELQRS